jgi:hypothetical protein
MPTMRRFLKHVRPRIFDDSTAADSNERYKGRQRTTNYRSWSRRRKQYEQFPEPVELQLVPGGPEEGNAVSSTAVVTSQTDMDSRSERAILETKSYTVHWDHNSRSNSSSDPENKD